MAVAPLMGSGFITEFVLARVDDNLTIARRMVLSPKTVRNHVSNVLTKLRVPDRSAAIVRAREGGLGAD